MVDQSYLGGEVFVFQADIGADAQEVVSILDPSTVFEHGLPTEAILGVLRPSATGEHQITPERFQKNPAFVHYLQGLISNRIHGVEGIRRAAQQQGEG